MKIDIPEINWHGKMQRIMSLDFHPFLSILATGGSDDPTKCDSEDEDGEFLDDKGFIKIWEIQDNTNNNTVKFVRSLQGGHTHNVNCVRFSHSGKYLASCGDDYKIVIWTIRERPQRMGSNVKVMTWCEYRVLSGHLKEVLDLEWSNDDQYLVSGGMDNRSMIWDVEKQKYIQILEGHKNFVQGVAIDPKFEFVLTQGNDRQVKIWQKLKTKQIGFYVARNLRKQILKDKNKQNQNENENEQQQQQNVNDDDQDDDISEINGNKSFLMFVDEKVFATFTKRPSWSPEGTFFLLPSSIYQESTEDKQELCVYGFLRINIQKPTVILRTNNKPAICTRFCSKIFKKNKEDEFSIFDLPYVIYFAIATIDSVMIYSTRSLTPQAVVGNIHYSLITDISWFGSKFVACSSSDGYCSFIKMENGDLGVEIENQELSEEQQEIMVKQSYYDPVKILPLLLSNQIGKFDFRPEIRQMTEQEKENTNAQCNQQFVQINQNENGEKKKRIIPAMIQKF